MSVSTEPAATKPRSKGKIVLVLVLAAIGLSGLVGGGWYAWASLQSGPKAPEGLTFKVVQDVCAKGAQDYAQLSLDGTTLTLHGHGENAEPESGLTRNQIECVLTVLKAPKEHIADVLTEQPTDSQEYEWADITSRWEYTKETGLVMELRR